MRYCQLSLRMLLLVIVPLTGAGLLAKGTGVPQLVRTGNQNDLAIDGHGYIRVTDDFAEHEQFVRGGTLAVNGNGQLCLQVGNFHRLIYPNITLPADCLKFEIDNEGRVLALQAGQIQLSQQGQIPLYTFPAENIPDLVGPVVTLTDAMGTPIECHPGTYKAGWLKQGFREVTPHIWDGKSLGFLLAGLVLGWLATCGRR